jgi:hypothetical protein
MSAREVIPHLVDDQPGSPDRILQKLKQEGGIFQSQ